VPPARDYLIEAHLVWNCPVLGANELVQRPFVAIDDSEGNFAKEEAVERDA
jgi:hypothetical protein